MVQAAELSPVKRALLELQELRAQLDELESQRTEPIAIVGLSLRFPGGARSAQEFWNLLRDGVDAIEPIPQDRWDMSAYFDADYTAPGKMYTRGGGFLHDIDHFDAAFFGIAPREAESMDPQQRLMLQVTWEALEHAGQAPDKLYNSATGVFLAMGNSDYARMVWADTENIDVYYATGTAFSVASGRLSYLLGLQGPSITLDTACSGSLVAVHLACQSLRTKESSLALAGGINLILTPEANINFSKAQMLATDDRCKTFDAAADGYVRSEGCGMVVLKRLSDALADGDSIIAVIRGSAINQDGRSSGLTAPNGPSQEAVIRAALAKAGVTPNQVQYVEAHGTGTSLGDPIEVQALGTVMREGRAADNRLKIGSVKTNIGHTEAAAGIAGLIKTALSLQHEAIPPHLHLRQLSPFIDWASIPVDVATQLIPWPRGEQPRIAGVSSFGFSGTNAHVILEEAPVIEPVTPQVERPLHLLALSGRTSTALRQRAEDFVTFLGEIDPDDFASVLYTANAGRSHYSSRLALTAPSPDDMKQKLLAWLDGQADAAVQQGYSTEAPEVAFLFSGQGEQYIDMGRQLYETQPVFRDTLNECAALLEPYLPQSLLSVIFPEAGEESALEQMTYAQPAIFSIEYALAKLWESWGIRPTMVLGHSVGEYAAACIAGVFSLADGLKLVAARGRLMDGLPQTGEMMVVFAEEERVRAAIAPYIDRVSIAVINGPKSIVISGEKTALADITESLSAERIRSRRLAVTQASHSPLMEPMLDEFENIARTVQFHAPRVGYVSAMMGKLAGAKDIAAATYWRRHSREAVLFAPAMQALYDEGYRVFLEIGPNPTLLSNARHNLPEESSLWLPSLRKGWEDWAQMLDSLGALYAAGAKIDWQGFDQPYVRRKLPVPTYPWEGERYWLSSSGRAPAQKKSVWEAVVQAGERQSTQGPLDLAAHTYPAKWDVLARLTQAYIVHTLRSLGVFLKPGERHTVDSLLHKLNIEATYDHLLERWLNTLSDHGLIQRGDGVYTNRAPLPDPDLRSVQAEARTVLADIQPLLDYIERCGSKLEAILTGRESPLETLFPDGSYDTTDYIYHGFPMAAYFNNIVAEAAKTAVESATGKTIRILEVGAGTGGTTTAVLPALPAQHIVYQFTDTSDFFLARAGQRFEAYPFVQYGLLNLEIDPQEQGYPYGGYDMVIGANVLHATRNLDQTLGFVRDLLAPGGILLLYETTEHLSWYDITTGLIEGWQLFEDNWRSDNPLLHAPQWAEALHANGFDAVASFPGDNMLTAAFGQHVILARTPGGGAGLGVSGEFGGVQVEYVAVDSETTASSGDAVAQFIEELQTLPPADQLDLMVDFVRHQVRRVLRLDNGHPLDRRDRLMDIGVDSLMAVELRSRLTAALSLAEKLPATLIFDYPSPEAIAQYLLRLLALDGAADTSPAPAPQAVVKDAEIGADVGSLTDEEVEAMLLRKLKDIQ